MIPAKVFGFVWVTCILGHIKFLSFEYRSGAFDESSPHHLFSTSIEWVLRRAEDQIGNNRVTDFVLPAIIIHAKSFGLCVGFRGTARRHKALGILSFLSQNQSPIVSLLNDTEQSVFTSCKEIEILLAWTYFGITVQNFGFSGYEVLQQNDLTPPYYELALHEYIAFLCPYRNTKMWIFESLVLLVLLNCCKTWTLIIEKEMQNEVFDNSCLCRIMRYRWFYRVSNWRLLCETGSRTSACIVIQRKFIQYRHVPCFSEFAPAY